MSVEIKEAIKRQVNSLNPIPIEAKNALLDLEGDMSEDRWLSVINRIMPFIADRANAVEAITQKEWEITERVNKKEKEEWLKDKPKGYPKDTRLLVGGFVEEKKDKSFVFTNNHNKKIHYNYYWIWDKPPRNIHFINRALKYLTNIREDVKFRWGDDNKDGNIDVNIIILHDGGGKKKKTISYTESGYIFTNGGGADNFYRFLVSKIRELKPAMIFAYKQSKVKKKENKGIMAGDSHYHPLNEFWDKQDNKLTGAYKSHRFLIDSYIKNIENLNDIERVNKLVDF